MSKVNELVNMLANEDYYRPLEEFAFVRLPIHYRNYLLPALKQLSQQSKAKKNDFTKPVFAFFYQDKSFLIDKTEYRGILGFDFYATIDDFSKLKECCLLTLLSKKFVQSGTKQELSLILSFNNINAKKINVFISQACLVLMGNNRLLRHYGCTFYFPIYTSDEYKPSLDKMEAVTQIKYSGQEQAQAYLYFNPPIRDYLFDIKGENLPNNLKPITEWLLKKEGLQLRLQHPKEERNITADITSVRLYQYFNNLCMLAVTVKPAGIIDDKSSLYYGANDDRWWYCLAFSGQQEWSFVKELQINSWLLFTKLARVLFASFVEQKYEHKIAQIDLLKNSEPIGPSLTTESSKLEIQSIKDNHISPVVSVLLKEFFTEIEYEKCFDNQYHQTFDDRMFVNVDYGYAGTKLKKQDFDKLFKLALYVDTENDIFDAFNGYAYDPEFLTELADRQSYKRWKDNGMMSGYTNYSNVYLGYDHFSNESFARLHVPYIYGRMLLMTLFYQASLRHYNCLIMQVTKKLSLMEDGQNIDSIIKDVQKLRKEFIRFTNVYWFHEVTSQIQGQEIFKLQQQALELNRDYEILKDEMERMDEYLQGLHSQKMDKYSKNLNHILIVFTVVALLFAFFQIILGEVSNIGNNPIVIKDNFYLRQVFDFFQSIALPTILIIGLAGISCTLKKALKMAFSWVRVGWSWVRVGWSIVLLLLLLLFMVGWHVFSS